MLLVYFIICIQVEGKDEFDGVSKHCDMLARMESKSKERLLKLHRINDQPLTLTALSQQKESQAPSEFEVM